MMTWLAASTPSSFPFPSLSSNLSSLSPPSLYFPAKRLRLSHLGFCAKRSKRGSRHDPVQLEAEILEFMERSRNPNAFPTKEELIAAGKADLAEAVARQGGWLTFGWDLDQEEEGRRISLDSACCSGSSVETKEKEVVVEDETGIQGILRRLERQRRLLYGAGAVEKHVNGEKSWGESGKGETDADDMSATPDMWRTWSLQRVGNPASEFEAAEIVPNFEREKVSRECDGNVSLAEIEVTQRESKMSQQSRGSHCDTEEMYEDQIPLHFQHLKSQLNSSLHILHLGSKSDIIHKQDHESSVKELLRLSDELEFKQTEIMNAKKKLRSIKAKLAVIEHKLPSYIVSEAHKRIDRKKKKLDAARKAIHLLRTVSIIWPNSSSEVLLAGSFDGWTSQRRMKRSKEGIFTLNLKLYPGRYEIKFIVDGVWMIDPLRPVVYNNGYENNLFIVS